jgi:GTPase SAR1 family protein
LTDGVDETPLIHSFHTQTFTKEMVSTVGPSFSEITVEIENDVLVVLQVWDTNDDEQYQSVSRLCYRDAQVAFVCYDGPRFGIVNDWAFNLHHLVPDCQTGLVMTKLDFLNTAFIEVHLSLRDVVPQSHSDSTFRGEVNFVIPSLNQESANLCSISRQQELPVETDRNMLFSNLVEHEA